MKLETDDGEQYAGSSLWLTLTENEARELAEGLIVYFTENPRDEGWHDHLGDSLTVGIEPASEPLAIRIGLNGNTL